MNLDGQIIVIFICFFISVWFDRGFLGGIVLYQLNNSAYKKRKKGETLREWLFFSRYHQEIPRLFLYLYLFILIIHPLVAILCVILSFINLSNYIGDKLTRIVYYFDVLYILLINLLFWSSKPGFAYSRWIRKNKGSQPRRKK